MKSSIINKKIFVFSLVLLFIFSLHQDGHSGVKSFLSKFKKSKGDLKIIAVSPRGGTEGVRESDSVTITFNDAMVALKKLSDPIKKGPLKIIPERKGTYKWLGTKTLAFYPSKPFPKNSKITAVIKKGITSITGKKLKKDYKWNFETKRPRFRRSNPYNNRKWIELDTSIYLYFDMPMKKDQAKRYIVLSENGVKRSYSIRYIKKDELRSWERNSFKVKTALVLSPDDEFNRNSKIQVLIKKGLPAKEGTLGLKRSSQFIFYTYYSFEYTGRTYQDILPYNYRYCDVLSLEFTNPVEYRELYKHMYLKPKIKLPIENVADSTWSTHKFCLSLPYKPETSYKLVIDRNLRDRFGQTLDNDIEIEFNVGSYLPRFSMPSGMGVVESYEGRKIPITLINPENMSVKSSIIKKDDLIPFLLAKNYFYIPYKMKKMYKHVSRFKRYYDYQKTTPYEPKVPRNKTLIRPLRLSPYINNKKYGFLDLKVSGAYHNSTSYNNTFVQLTDMGLTGKFSAEKNLIFVTDLKTGKPVKEANVEIRDDFNKVLWKGKTDKNGLVKTPGWLNFKLKKYSYAQVRQWAFAQKGKDTVFINNQWGTGVDPWRFGIWTNPDSDFPFYKGDITTERGIYRPGEKVHFKGVLREKIKGDWIISSKKKLNYTIKDSRYNKIKEGTVKLNSFGTFAFKFKLPDDAPTGYYSVSIFEKKKKSKIRTSSKQKPRVRKGNINIHGNFRVEVFQPVQFDVRVWYENKKYFLDDKMKFKITGWYLFGAPMNEKKVHYTVSGKETFYSPPGNPGFRYTKLRWLDDRYYYPPSKKITSKTTKLDKKGELSVPVTLSIDKDVHSMNVNIEATVYGEDQQRVSGRKHVLVHGSDYYIGIKREDYFVEKNKKAEFEIISVNPDGKRRENDEVTVKVYRRYWNSVRKAGVGGRYFWESEKVDKLITTKEMKTKKKGSMFRFVPKKTGMYFLKVTGTDNRDRKIRADDYIYSVGSGYAPWLMTDDDRIELVPNKKNFRPGDTAQVLVKSPYNKCTALVTVEREFVIDSWVEEIEGTASVVKVPIKQEYLPNVFVGVSLIKGRVEDKTYTNYGTDLGKPSFKIGYTELSVSPEGRHLIVDVNKSHETRGPGEPLEVNFQVKDKKGKGVYSECMVAVCDVGVLNLIGFKTPDFFNTFYGPRALGVMTSDTRLHIIGQRNYGEKGENRGGGGAAEAKMAKKRNGDNGLDMDIFSFRKNFLSTAFYKSDVLTDKQGKAKVKFNVPDNLTTFRIMVSALNKRSYFGAGEDSVIVKKYLMLKSTLPQFAIVGDEFKAGAVVYNYTEKDTKIKMQIKVENAQVKGDKFKEVFVKKGESADIRFNIVAEKVGKVKVKIASQADKFQDAIEKTFEVKAPRLVESVALYESMNRDRTFQKIEIPTEKEVFPGAGYLKVTLAPSAFSGMEKGIDYLLEYPYGCLEQRVSKVLPVVLSKRLILDLNLTIYTEKELDSLVKEVIKVVPNYQAYNGGFSYWPSKYWTSPWLSAYVSLFLIKAEKEGYKIDKKVLKRALRYLDNYARSHYKRENLPYSVYCHLSTRAYVAYVLALGGKPNRTLINDLNKNVDKIPLFGKANLLKALYHAKYSKKYLDELRQILFNKVKVASTTAHFEDEYTEGLYWIHSSSVRATSAILQTFMETGTENPLTEKVVKWLKRSRKKRGRFENTQDNVHAFWAMTDYYKVYEKVKPKFRAEIEVEGKKLLSASFNKRTDPIYMKKINFEKFKRGKELLFDIQRKGKGRLYYGFRMNYAPRKLLKSRNEGIKIVKWYETLDGKKVDGDVFQKGKDYVVVIKVNSKQERHFVMLDDPIPAGFKILNLSFQTESREAYKGVKKKDRWWGSFNHTENYEDRVLVFADSLYYGDHTYKYVVRAVTPGKYLLPPSKIEEMYDPDVFGYYGQQYVKIK